jgi:hypothetical protein
VTVRLHCDVPMTAADVAMTLHRPDHLLTLNDPASELHLCQRHADDVLALLANPPELPAEDTPDA